MIYHRFGSNNQLLVMKINTVFASLEFNLFLQTICDSPETVDMIEEMEPAIDK